MLSASITQKRLLTSENETRNLFMIKWLKLCIHNKVFPFPGWNLQKLRDSLDEDNNLTGENEYGISPLSS